MPALATDRLRKEEQPCFSALYQVLHKFLEVFSEFDWDKYCLSLQGPIVLSSFPDPRGKCCIAACLLIICHASQDNHAYAWGELLRIACV